MESQAYPWLNTFLSYFKTIKTYDTEIESFRSSISSIPEFTPLSLFTYLDKNLKSFLSLNDFKSFLSSENVSFDEIKLRKLIHNFDKDGDFSLNLKEFTYLIQSKRKKIKNEYFPNLKLELNQEIKNDLKTILEKEMDLIKELNDIAKEIINSENFSTYEAFTLIVGKEKYITKKNFGKFLKDNYMEISDEDVEQIMFRIDADNDDKISYEEFKEIFFTLNDDNLHNNKNNTNNEIANKYLNLEEEKENNIYEKIEEQNEENNFNDNNNYNYNINQDEEDNKNIEEENNKNIEEDNKNIEEDNNINPDKKKKKTTKKVILKPKLKSNLNNDSESNFLHSQKPLIKDEELNENNYIKKGKCVNCGVPKKDITITSKYNIEPEIDKKINNFEEQKISNINLKGKYNNNNLSIPKNENTHEHKSGGCKACLYTAKNIFSDLRSKNNINSPFISNDNYNINKSEEVEENIEIKKDMDNLEENKEEEEDDNEDNEYDIYKNKDKLLKKYGIIIDNSNQNLENNIDISNFNFSTQKKYTYVREINNNDNNDNLNNNLPQENENVNTLLKSKNKIPLSINNNLIETNYSSNVLSNSPRFSIIPKNDINEKKKLLFKLFVNFIEKENEVRKIKENLSSCPEANPQNIFDLFNINQSNKISSSDILETLNSLSSNDSINQDDIKYIFKKFNKTSSNGFTFYELKNILFSDQIQLNNDEVNLEEKTKNIIFEFFKEVIEGEKEIENSRIVLNEATNNIYYDLFESIKKRNKLGIENDDIETFMKENEYDVKEEELNIIMEKMDKNRDGLIDYSEFIDEIKPMNFC